MVIDTAQTLVEIYDADQGDERNFWTDGFIPLRRVLEDYYHNKRRTM